MITDDERARLAAQAANDGSHGADPADDLEDGATCVEDSGADSFLDRFTPPRDGALRW
ncbi:hypothetical protein GCM10008171_20740 [Methylopila jiangsuensis]|uniref:Uncharacterized protein n=1 Tax=Methylopila jiangsuensis TaxID=586230 RepID=A0A9W6JJ70_9HYPH|nr:hypothetical protein [Methylopila jiangsuensis]MDR6286833.1 hypothetical protein [Methylopila jiangsuensis]GLK76820.1 hypothetical protein GCM10008171_20740 [Methylopila jiangsuensis]